MTNFKMFTKLLFSIWIGSLSENEKNKTMIIEEIVQLIYIAKSF